MSRYNMLAAISFFIVMLVASVASADTLKIVATLPDLAAIAAEVGGERVEVQALARPSEDPHYVDARPSHIITLNKADLLILNGLELEVGWLPNLLTRARNTKINPGADGYLDASTVVKLLQVPTAKIDRAMGDIHPGGNPHYTFDPRRGADIARALGQRMAKLDPAGAKHYTTRADKLAQDLEAIAARARARFDKLPAARRVVVTYHASTIYLTDWLGLKEIVQIEPKPGISPNPQHVAHVLGLMRANAVSLIFQEEFYPRKTSQKLAELAKARLVIIEGGARVDEGQTYTQRVEALAEKIYAAISAQ